MSTAVLHTTLGDISIAMYDDLAPATVAHFTGLATGTLTYATANAAGGMTGPFYDGCEFHNIVPGFLIQGGDPTGTGRGDAGIFFDNEISPDLQYDTAFRVGMANRSADTNSCQFFITLRAMVHLHGNNPIFGQVADPTAQLVVAAIAAAPTANGRPVPPVIITSVTVS